MLVSAIMPVYNRRDMVPLAIRSYLSQDWTEKELIVVDDGPDVLEDLFRDIPNCTYMRLAERQRIGAKRNIACELGHGEVMVHFDSDDWSAPERITDQVNRLVESGKAVSGYHSLLFYDAAKNEASKYGGDKTYSCGSALCYRKDFWTAHKFINSSLAEDNEFVTQAQQEKQIISVDALQMMVARIHTDNTCGHVPLRWPVVPVTEIPQEFFEAMRG